MFSTVLLYLSVSFTVAFAVMCVVWRIQKKNKNAGIVDIVWAASFPAYVLIYYSLSPAQAPRQIVLLGMVLLWGLRLAVYLFGRNWNKPEDARYTNLRKEWGKSADLKMFLFFQFQAVLSVLLSIVFVRVFINSDGSPLSYAEIAGIILWIVGFIGESLADYQMKNFKKNPDNQGKVCNDGLWYYSRHPNYFFEWLIWLAYFIFALSSPYGWIAVICPALMLHFLINVTGVRYSEEHMLASKGTAYRRYQETTSAFVPWFKKNLESRI